MFWDKAAAFYDFFENVYNGKVYKGLATAVAEMIAPTDMVLECACGTGIITRAVAPRCQHITATDLSDGMLKQARKHCARFSDVTLCKANIMQLEYPDSSFDKVVAGNVIHLLDDPQSAIHELERVCKPGGHIILPTYVNNEQKGRTCNAARLLEMLGVNFKRQFSLSTYRDFFAQIGYPDVEYKLVEGRMPCAIAIIKKQK